MSHSRIIVAARAIRFLILFCLVACGRTQKNPTTVLQADKTRYVADLTFIARAPRTIVDPHHQEVQDLCASRFSALGFTVERYKYDDGGGFIGTLPGTSRPVEIVIVSAHYDTIMGGDGADDNASGVAAVLESPGYWPPESTNAHWWWLVGMRKSRPRPVPIGMPVGKSRNLPRSRWHMCMMKSVSARMRAQ